MLRIILLVFFCICTRSLVTSQTCEVWDGEPSLCKNALQPQDNSNHILFIPNGYTQAYFTQEASRTINNINNPLFTPQCRSIFIEFICYQTFRSCLHINSSSTNQTINLPSAPCRNLCEELNRKCGSELDKYPLLKSILRLPNCESDIDPYRQSVGYPDQYYNITTSDGVFTLPCSDGANVEVPIQVTESDIDCGPLVYDSSVTPPCSVPCINSIFTKSEWKGAAIVGLILSLISFISSFFLVIIFMLQREYFQFPKCIHLMIAVNANIASVGFLISLIGDQINKTSENENPLMCQDAYNVGSSPACTASGSLILYGAVSGCVWWLALSFYLVFALNVMKIGKTKVGGWIKEHSGIICTIFGFGLGAVLLIIALTFKSSGIVPWCFASGNGWELGLYYIPILIMALFGFLGIAMSSVHIMLVTYSVKGYVGEQMKKIPPEMFKLLGFLVIWSSIFSFNIVFRLDSIVKEDQIRSSLQEYMQCYLTAQYYPDIQDITSCHWNRGVSKGIWFIGIITVGLEGLVVALFLGVTTSNARFIAQIIRERKLHWSRSRSNF